MKNHSKRLFMDPLRLKKVPVCFTTYLTCGLFYFWPDSVPEKDKKTDCACVCVAFRLGGVYDVTSAPV